ncbi:Chitinase, GH18 family [Spirosomataceae bacterium TFI 002]|nr:Chitinase, GH18 family [Spirosomataceae bacterium TFI 002]
MKKTLILFLTILSTCSFAQKKDFKVIGYFVPNIPVNDIPFENLTHINYSFAIPAKSGDTLIPLKNDKSLIELVKKGKETQTKIFISIGGWGIGDGGGDDTRFHKMAETPAGRARFIENTMDFVMKYDLDGVDLDWEYPDEDSPSADQYVELIRDLSTELHEVNKELTAAVISYGKKGGGVKKETFEYFDWINLMAYDDDYGPDYVKAHSPYSLAIKSLSYWILERGLPRDKAVLGLPFYSKRGMGNYGPSYKKLLEQGASPYDDYHLGSFYNGMLTIEAKTELAIKEGCAGVMVWEISHDTSDEFSLFKKINEVVNRN